LKIRVGSDDKTKADIVIYDTQGHAVFKQKLNINKGENNARIDATRFPNGMLVVVILFENGAKHIQQIMHLK
jgi:hypothetical protein